MEMDLEKNRDAEQLGRIARLELGTPLTAANCLVFGTGKTAAELADWLSVRAASCEQWCDESEVRDGSKPFELLVLLAPLARETTERLMQPNGLVVDFARTSETGWTVIDSNASFRRVRVLRLSRRGV